MKKLIFGVMVVAAFAAVARGNGAPCAESWPLVTMRHSTETTCAPERPLSAEKGGSDELVVALPDLGAWELATVVFAKASR